MSLRRIIVTGGSGRAGQHVINHLKSHGHTVLNVDFAAFPDRSAGINTMNVDLADPGQVFSAFAASQFDMAEFKATSEPPGKADAIVHLAARAGNLVVPDSETFKSNVLGTWNVLEASSRLGIKKVILASSETTHGVIYAQGKKDWKHFPLEEDYPVDPPGM
jgi:nucleoside-diphosphate-sugar epimerase